MFPAVEVVPLEVLLLLRAFPGTPGCTTMLVAWTSPLDGRGRGIVLGGVLLRAAGVGVVWSALPPLTTVALSKGLPNMLKLRVLGTGTCTGRRLVPCRQAQYTHLPDLALACTERTETHSQLSLLHEQSTGWQSQK